MGVTGPDVLRPDDYRAGDSVYVWWKHYDRESDEDEPHGCGVVTGVLFDGKAVEVRLNCGGETIKARTFNGSYFDGTGTRMVTRLGSQPVSEG